MTFDRETEEFLKVRQCDCNMHVTIRRLFIRSTELRIRVGWLFTACLLFRDVAVQSCKPGRIIAIIAKLLNCCFSVTDTNGLLGRTSRSISTSLLLALYGCARVVVLLPWCSSRPLAVGGTSHHLSWLSYGMAVDTGGGMFVLSSEHARQLFPSTSTPHGGTVAALALL